MGGLSLFYMVLMEFRGVFCFRRAMIKTRSVQGSNLKDREQFAFCDYIGGKSSAQRFRAFSVLRSRSSSIIAGYQNRQANHFYAWKVPGNSLAGSFKRASICQNVVQKNDFRSRGYFPIGLMVDINRHRTGMLYRRKPIAAGPELPAGRFFATKKKVRAVKLSGLNGDLCHELSHVVLACWKSSGDWNDGNSVLEFRSGRNNIRSDRRPVFRF